MEERKLKKRLFWFLLIAKILVASVIWFHWATGGYSRAELIAAIAMILPLFTVYTSVMWKEFSGNPYLKNKNEKKPESKKLSQAFRYGVWAFFTVYVALIAYFVSLKPQGIISFTELGSLIAATESGFGIYLGQIVFTLFKPAPEPVEEAPES